MTTITPRRDRSVRAAVATVSAAAVCAAALAGCASGAGASTAAPAAPAGTTDPSVSASSAPSTGRPSLGPPPSMGMVKTTPLRQIASAPQGTASLPWTLVKQDGADLTLGVTFSGCASTAEGYTLSTTASTVTVAVLGASTKTGECAAMMGYSLVTLTLPAADAYLTLQHAAPGSF